MNYEKRYRKVVRMYNRKMSIIHISCVLKISTQQVRKIIKEYHKRFYVVF